MLNVELNAEQIRTLERITTRALPSQFNRFYDGWLMRFNQGYTQRANAVYPIYGEPDDVLSTILHCEAEYNSIQQPTRFKLTQATFPHNLDAILETRGYESSCHHYVQAIALKDFMPVSSSLEHQNHADEKWTTTYLDWMNTPAEYHNAVKHTLISVPQHADFCTLRDAQGRAVALGYGVRDDVWYGLFGIVVNAEMRHQGYGQLMTQSLMTLGKSQGALYAYLQVDGGNAKALQLYEKMGFHTQYEYWYRLRR